MDLREHFDAKTALLLEYAIQQHPDLAKAIYLKVVHGRNLPDNFAGIAKTGAAFGPVSGQYNRAVNGTPILTKSVTQAPKPPKPELKLEPKSPKPPKPEPKPRGQTRPRMQTLKDTQPPEPTPPKPKHQPKPPARPRHPKLHIDTFTHENLTYITLHEGRKLTIGTPLEHLGIYKDGTVFSHYSTRIPIIRRLELGVAAMSPTVMYELTDCQRVINARLNDIEPSMYIRKYPNNSISLHRIEYAGVEWMKVSEAMAIAAGLTVRQIHKAWTNPTKKKILKHNLYQWIAELIRGQKIPSLTIGERKGSFVRTIDMMPLAGTRAVDL